MQQLPQFQSELDQFTMMQNAWAGILNPVIKNPILYGRILNASLNVGDNTINHLLGRATQGWFLVGNNAVVNLYDKQSTNQMKNLTLILNSDAVANVNIYVF